MRLGFTYAEARGLETDEAVQYLEAADDTPKPATAKVRKKKP